MRYFGMYRWILEFYFRSFRDRTAVKIRYTVLKETLKSLDLIAN